MFEVGFDLEVFVEFFEMLCCFVCEWLVLVEVEVIVQNCVLDLLLDVMCEFGLFGLIIFECYGGFGLWVDQYVEVMLELSWVVFVFCFVFVIGIGMVVIVFKNDGIEEQCELWFLKLVGGVIVCFGLIELGSGFDSVWMQICVLCDGVDYVLNGIKCYIINVLMVEFILVMVWIMVEILLSNVYVSGFFVLMDMLGISVGMFDRKMGQ